MTASRTRLPLLLSGFALLLPLAACSTTASAPGALLTQDETVVGDYLKARFAANRQQLDVAASAYARAADAAPQDALLLRHAFFYELAAGNVGDARLLAEQLLEPEYASIDPDEPPVRSFRQAIAAAQAEQSVALPLLTVAAAQMRDGDYRDALKTLSAETETAYARSITWLMEAWSIYEIDGADAGLAALERSDAPAFTGFTPLHRALMLDAAGRVDDAAKAYALAAESYPSEQTLMAHANFLERRGRKADAIDAYRAMVEESMTLQRAGRLGLIRLGEPLTGETAEMVRQAKKHKAVPLVRSGADGAGLALYHFAWASYRQALQEQAAAWRAGFTNIPVMLNTPLAFAQLAGHLDPELDAAHYLIGGIYNSYEMYDDAIYRFGLVGFNDAFYEYAVSDRASAFVDKGEKDSAKALLSDYVETDSYSVSSALYLAGLWSDDEQYTEAEETLSDAILRIEALPEVEQGVDLWRYYFSRGVLHHDMDNWPAAEADLLRAMELSHEEPYVLNYLGYSWVERGENLEQAFDMIEKALEKEPTSGAITDSLGWAYYMRGDYETAVTYLEKAVTLEPADAVITDHLGDAYWRVGRRIEAAYEWRRALTYDPEPALREEIERKLAHGGIQTADNGAADAGSPLE